MSDTLSFINLTDASLVSEDELLDRAREGDRSAFGTLYLRHRDVLRCEVVPAAEGIDPGHLAGEVHDTIRSGLRFDVEVAVVTALEAGAPPITDLRSWD